MRSSRRQTGARGSFSSKRDKPGGERVPELLGVGRWGEEAPGTNCRATSPALSPPPHTPGQIRTRNPWGPKRAERAAHANFHPGARKGAEPTERASPPPPPENRKPLWPRHSPPSDSGSPRLGPSAPRPRACNTPLMPSRAAYLGRKEPLGTAALPLPPVTGTEFWLEGKKARTAPEGRPRGAPGLRPRLPPAQAHGAWSGDPSPW